MERFWTHYLVWLAVAVIAGGTLVAGCGQKGDLYLPEDSDPREQRE